MPRFIKELLFNWFTYVNQQEKNSILIDFISWYNNNINVPISFFDVGARDGLHSDFIALKRLRKFRCIGFEPGRREAKKLKDGNYGFDDVYPVGITGSNGTRRIYITKHTGCSSIYKPNHVVCDEFPVANFFNIVSTEEINTLTLDSVLEKYKICPPDFIKLDVQGAEYEILKSSPQALLNVTGVFLEGHLRELYIKEGLVSQIHSLMQSQGFRLVSINHCPMNFGGEIVELDLAYVRKIDKFSSEIDCFKAVLFCLLCHNNEYAAQLIT